MMGNLDDFATYLNMTSSLDHLEKLTDEMDKDIEESKKLMNEIQSKFRALPSRSKGPSESGLRRHEDLSKFLEADVPKLLLPDMCVNVVEIDLDNVIVTMKRLAENLKETYVAPESKTASTKKNISDIDLDEYASSLHQLGMRLANIKLTKRDEVNKRNPELETKLAQLCQDVNNFTQMVQAKTKLTESNKNWPEIQQENGSLQYNDIINKLLAGVNEVIYLLQNNN